jgi:hypothetical protein
MAILTKCLIVNILYSNVQTHLINQKFYDQRTTLDIKRAAGFVKEVSLTSPSENSTLKKRNN